MIFVDTSAWIFLFDQRRGGKEAISAQEFYQRNTRPLVVTDLILEETHKWLVHHAFPKERALRILQEFINESFAKIVLMENTDRTAAIQFIHKYLDQGLSYTDAVTIAMMKRLKVKEIFSFDAHFDLFPGIVRVPD